MDFFDFIPIVPGPEPAPGRNRREHLVGGVVVFGLPMLHMCLMTFGGLSQKPGLALLWLPVTFSVLGALVCRAARLSLGRSIVAVVGCLWWCMLVGLTFVVLDILIFPF